MKKHIIPIITYIAAPFALGFFNLAQEYVYILTILATTLLLMFYWNDYKLKFRLNIDMAVFAVMIAASWILLQGKYPLFFYKAGLSTINLDPAWAAVRLAGFAIITPIVEEIFTRGFLIRYLISSKWKSVAHGKFTWVSFIVTVLFFGLSHAEWLQGIVAGVLLNLLYYRTKRLEDCILAHAFANLILVFF